MIAGAWKRPTHTAADFSLRGSGEPGTARRALVERRRRDHPERRRRGRARRGERSARGWLLELLPESRADPAGLLDRVCAAAEATARGEGAFTVLPDRHGLLAHALLVLAAQRHGLTIGELAALFPGAGRAARGAVAWLRGAAAGGARRAWGEDPVASGRRHAQTQRGPSRIGARARRRRRGGR